MRGFAVDFAAALVMAYVDLSFILAHPETKTVERLLRVTEHCFRSKTKQEIQEKKIRAFFFLSFLLLFVFW